MYRAPNELIDCVTEDPDEDMPILGQESVEDDLTHYQMRLYDEDHSSINS